MERAIDQTDLDHPLTPDTVMKVQQTQESTLRSVPGKQHYTPRLIARRSGASTHAPRTDCGVLCQLSTRRSTSAPQRGDQQYCQVLYAYFTYHKPRIQDFCSPTQAFSTSRTCPNGTNIMISTATGRSPLSSLSQELERK
jgi:hypothetical protein